MHAAVLFYLSITHTHTYTHTYLHAPLKLTVIIKRCFVFIVLSFNIYYVYIVSMQMNLLSFFLG